jgi:hypothetical protein
MDQALEEICPLQPRNLWLQVLNDYMYDFNINYYFKSCV